VLKYVGDESVVEALRQVLKHHPRPLTNLKAAFTLGQLAQESKGSISVNAMIKDRSSIVSYHSAVALISTLAECENSLSNVNVPYVHGLFRGVHSVNLLRAPVVYLFESVKCFDT
jgi:hypothetical protein